MWNNILEKLDYTLNKNAIIRNIALYFNISKS